MTPQRHRTDLRAGFRLQRWVLEHATSARHFPQCQECRQMPSMCHKCFHLEKMWVKKDCNYTCVCVLEGYAYVPVHVCRYTSDTCRGHRKMPQHQASSFIDLHTTFWDWVSHWIWSLTIWLDWLDSKLQGPSCLHFPSLGHGAIFQKAMHTHSCAQNLIPDET